MRIARVISPVHSLGPGERICLWTQGCSKNCPGCISPELQPFGGSEIDEAVLAQVLIHGAAARGCRGLTISGGDPMEQSESLARLLELVRPHFSDILIYTGFTLEQLQTMGSHEKRCLELVDVLIDGRYIHSRNTPGCILRGSDNQRIHYCNPALQPRYEAYMAQGRILESFTHNGDVIITGIQNRRDVP